MRLISSKLVAAAAGALLDQVKQRERRLRRGHADERGLDRTGARKQLQHRGGDDAERAFGADENVPQIVAGVVLLQLVEPVQHASVGKHDFKAEHKVARDAVSERAGAAGIGREVAADGATALGAERQRKQAVDLRGGLLRLGQDDAGFAGHGVGGGVDFADAVEPRERERELRRDAASGRRRGRCCRPAARSASPSRWRVSGSPLLRRSSRAQHHWRVAAIEPALLRRDSLPVRRDR